jgi:hypothetical protein
VPPTTTLPTISSGVWEVGTDIQPGVYRVSGYWARLDEALEILDNDLTAGDNGFSLVSVLDTDAYVEINGAALNVDDSRPLDPVAEGFNEGTYLVNHDLAPGRYRINPPEGSTAYWARLDASMEIIDNDLSEGQLIVIVDTSDWALRFTGTIEAFPEG